MNDGGKSKGPENKYGVCYTSPLPGSSPLNHHRMKVYLMFNYNKYCNDFILC